MAPWADPKDLRLVIILLRELKDWDQSNLAREAGIDPGSLSRYEAAKKTPSPKTLERIAAAAGLPYAFAEELIPLCRGIRLASEQAAARGAFAAADPEAAAELDQRVTAAALRAAAPLLLELAALGQGGPRAEDRGWAAAQWEGMKDLPLQKQEMLIDTLEDERIWALGELLGLASVAAAADRADQALELAQLDLRAAQRIAEGSWRSLNEGLSWAYLGNARRVAGTLPAAREAFQASDRLWEAGAGGDPSGLLDATRRLDLKASLLMDDDKFAEALKLLEQAIAESRSDAARARLLLKQSTAFVLMGDAKCVVEVLERAAPLIDEKREPRLLWVHHLNLAVGFCDLQRYGEAQALLPRIREMVAELGKELDATRTLWLEGKIKAGFGFTEEACAAFEQVRQVFADQQITYDSAVVTLELAVLHLKEGRTAEVQELTRQLLPLFQAQKVSRKALATIKLFCEAVEKETLTAEVAQGLLADLRRAGA